MIDDPQQVNERIEEEYHGITLGKGTTHRQHLPKDAIREHDLYETVVDMVVTQHDKSMTVTDVEIDSQGRFVVPKKKASMYGFEAGEPISVFVDQVVLR